MSKVADILNRYKMLNEGDSRDKEVGGKDSKSDKVGDGGDASLRGIIESLKNDEFSKDNDSQKKAVAEMKKLAEADDEEANKFMKHMDESASKYEMKMKEELDGSDNKGAKDADDEDEEEGKFKKTGKDSPDFGEKKKKK